MKKSSLCMSALFRCGVREGDREEDAREDGDRDGMKDGKGSWEEGTLWSCSLADLRVSGTVGPDMIPHLDKSSLVD